MSKYQILLLATWYFEHLEYFSFVLLCQKLGILFIEIFLS